MACQKNIRCMGASVTIYYNYNIQYSVVRRFLFSSGTKELRGPGSARHMESPEFKKNIEKMGLQAEYLSPQESQARWMADNEKLSKIVQETGILDRIKEQKK